MYAIYKEHYRNGLPDEPVKVVTIHIDTKEHAEDWTRDLQANAFDSGLTIRYWYLEEEEAA